jgi:hypothetical protein
VNDITTTTADPAIIEATVVRGDLSNLTPKQRTVYYVEVCKSVGLNPLTKPFDYLKLNGKEILYATRACTDQLRQIHGVSLRVTSRETIGDVYVVTAQATDRTGRVDESTGAVPTGALKGEALANALMKAETKAKRRVTLSICGLGVLDETELDTIPAASIGVTPHGAIDEDAARARKAEDDRMGAEWAAMVDGISDVDALAKWCSYHGYMLHGLHATAKARLWRRIMAAWERVGSNQQDVRRWLAESREPIEVESES